MAVCYPGVPYHSTLYQKDRNTEHENSEGRRGVDASPASNSKGNEILLYKMPKVRILNHEGPLVDLVARYSNWKEQLRL